ncbi:Uncharacterised protein [Streptococcus pneumoniae]|nr:Uncharacterised protein [Streptococcus pneumoniae]
MTYKFSVCTAKKIDIEKTTNPKIAMTPRATKRDLPVFKILSEIAPPDKIKKNINNHGNELIDISLKSTWYCSVKYVGNQIKNNVMTNCTTKY